MTTKAAADKEYERLTRKAEKVLAELDRLAASGNADLRKHVLFISFIDEFLETLI